ncbi:7124_t:CDS:1, partial [Acaulospora morrowiae]
YQIQQEKYRSPYESNVREECEPYGNIRYGSEHNYPVPQNYMDNIDYKGQQMTDYYYAPIIPTFRKFAPSQQISQSRTPATLSSRAPNTSPGSSAPTTPIPSPTYLSNLPSRR